MLVGDALFHGREVVLGDGGEVHTVGGREGSLVVSVCFILSGHRGPVVVKLHFGEKLYSAGWSFCNISFRVICGVVGIEALAEGCPAFGLGVKKNTAFFGALGGREPDCFFGFCCRRSSAIIVDCFAEVFENGININFGLSWSSGNVNPLSFLVCQNNSDKATRVEFLS